MKWYYTYVLKSLANSSLYVGWTDNLKSRLHEHNMGNVNSTKSHKPYELIYFEACSNKNDAIRREKALKTGFGRAYLRRRLKDRGH